MDGRLFMAHEDVAQPWLAVQGVVERQRGPARVAEDRVDTAFDQCGEQCFGTVAQKGGTEHDLGGGWRRLA